MASRLSSWSSTIRMVALGSAGLAMALRRYGSSSWLEDSPRRRRKLSSESATIAAAINPTPTTASTIGSDIVPFLAPA
jgi:hypothetical protein